jgi:hypothetical protein
MDSISDSDSEDVGSIPTGTTNSLIKCPYFHSFDKAQKHEVRIDHRIFYFPLLSVL